jgi:hypothetical protein
MDRRGFLKGVFGAAIVATIPKKVVEEIESLPLPTKEQGPIYTPKLLDIELPDVSNAPDPPLLYVYDEKLLGYSTRFDFVSEHRLSILHADGVYWYPPQKQRYEIVAHEMKWERLVVEKAFSECKPLNILIKNEELRASAQAHIIEIDLMTNRCIFAISGEILIEFD